MKVKESEREISHALLYCPDGHNNIVCLRLKPEVRNLVSYMNGRQAPATGLKYQEARSEPEVRFNRPGSDTRTYACRATAQLAEPESVPFLLFVRPATETKHLPFNL